MVGWFVRTTVVIALVGCPAAVQPVDNDGDGWFSRSDCNDSNPAINPGVLELPGDGLDNDCDPSTRDDDLDQDGVLPPVDCEPNNPFVPASFEVPYDGLDNDCNPITADDDLDGDGYIQADDCDDDDPAIHPAAAEIPYDLLDNDCDPETVDDDLDGDGLPDAEDCNDFDPTFNNPVPWYVDCDGDGFAGVRPTSSWAIPDGVLGCTPPSQSPCPNGMPGGWTLLEPVHDPDHPDNFTADCNDLEADAFPQQTEWFSYAGGPAIHPYDFDCDGRDETDYGSYQCIAIGGANTCSVTAGYDLLIPQCGGNGDFIDSCTYDTQTNTCSPTTRVDRVVTCQ